MNTIIITVLVLTGLSFVLALLLSLADKYIADYGQVELTINDDKKMTVDGGKSLLSTLRDQKIFIPSACGGKGTCGYCKVRVLDGGGPTLATELPWLNDQERSDSTRLACQVKVKQDIRISIPEELFNVREYEAEIVALEDLTDRIKRVRMKFLNDEHISFKPGQYIQFMAPKYEGNNEEVFRAYSIASSANDTGHLELFIGYTGGIATTYVHKFLKVGDIVKLNGPHGDFYYHDDDSEMLMVAAGTGMAPIMSILYHMRDQDIHRKARYMFGARTPDDLFVLDEMHEFEEELYDFKFLPTLSRTTEEMHWTGDTGRVNNSVEKYVEEGKNYTAYLCGNPKMIESMKAALMEKGIPEDKIYYDEF